MYVDVKYAAQVKPGDWFAGTVNPSAPTRPCQPCASAMRVRDVEVTPAPEGRGSLYRFRFDHPRLAGLPSGQYRPADLIMTIVNAA